MPKISTEELELELKQIDPRIVIVPNQNRPGASNVLLNGVDICPWVPSFEVQQDHTEDYTYRLPNDMIVPFKTITEIKEIVTMTLKRTEDREYADILFGVDEKIEEETYGEHSA